MCGIVAVIGPDPGRSLDKMLEAMQHRGPDARGVLVGKNAALGSQRLSIVGGTHGAQPIHNAGSGLSLVYNGEIYNYKTLQEEFGLAEGKSVASEAEVMFDLFDKFRDKPLPLLDGIFALVVHDEERDTFFAARDRYGVKPLYYLQTEDSWFFASEIKAFLETGEDMRLVQELPPGHILTREATKPYYTDSIRPMSVPSPELLHAMIDHAVSKQLQADPEIKIGVFLSGGLDSSIIAAAASKHRQDIIAFTIGTGITPDVEAARIVAKHLEVETILDPGDLEKRLPEAIRAMESFNVVTVIEGILTMELSRAAAEVGVKVILSGGGADELFAGYGFMRNLESVALQASRKILLANIGNTECKRLDRASMAFSVEARVPFLDWQVVEWAMSLPSDCLIRRAGDTVVQKWILKEAFKDDLPHEIVHRTKVAFDDGSGILPFAARAFQTMDRAAVVHGRRCAPDLGPEANSADEV